MKFKLYTDDAAALAQHICNDASDVPNQTQGSWMAVTCLKSCWMSAMPLGMRQMGHEHA
jgi:hypothetical protein